MDKLLSSETADFSGFHVYDMPRIGSLKAFYLRLLGIGAGFVSAAFLLNAAF